MTYLRRVLKYLIQLSLIFVVLIGILMLAGMVPADVALAFKKGWESVWFILGLFAVMAAIYPFFGYGKRQINAKGEPAGHWAGIEEALEGRGYVSAGQLEDGSRRYHLKNPVARAARLWEDTLTITPVLGGFQAEGLARDLARAVMSIDHKINSYE